MLIGNRKLEKFLVTRLTKLTNDDKLVWEISTHDTAYFESKFRNKELCCGLWRGDGVLHIAIIRRRPHVLNPDVVDLNENQCNLWDLIWAIKRQRRRMGKSMDDYEFSEKMIMRDRRSKEKLERSMLLSSLHSLNRV